MMASAWLSWCPPFYLENDDVTIRMALEGRTVPGGTPTGFALLTHAAFGWAIVAMQRALPLISWWDVALAGLLLWALGVLLALAWDALGSDWLARATTVAVIVLALAPILASFQFTISSTLAGGAGVLLAVGELGAARPRRSVLVMAFLLFVVGVLMRPMGGSAGGVMAAGISLPLVRGRRWWVSISGIIATASALFLVARSVDGALYGTNRGWDEYYRYNWMVGLGLEWGGDLSNAYARQISESVGWTANDWLMLVGSWGVDPVVHGFDRVSRAYQTQMAIVGQVGALSWLFTRAMNLSADDVWFLFRSSAPLAFATAVLAAAYGTRRAVTQVVAVLMLFLAFCFAVQVTFDKLPWRLLGPLEAISFAAIVVTIGRSRRATSPLMGILALGGIIVVTAPILSATAREAGGHLAQSQRIEEDVSALNQLRPNLVIFYGSRFPREYWWRPFHHSPVALPAVALGWNNQNPQLQRFLADTGHQPLLRALCTDPSIFIVADRDPLDLVTTYMHEHFNTAVQWTQVYDGSFPAWRCSATNGPSSGSPSTP
jgi:hypothetical protein